MKLDDAYNAWGDMSENRELAQKTKKIFHNIWWLIPTNKPCNYYTLEVLGRALVQANGAHSDKVSAASVMCHVLNYAHNIDPEGNNKPDFTFSDIVNYTGEKDDRGQVPGSQQTSEDAPARDLSPVIPANEDAPLLKVKPAAKAKRMAELAKRDGGEAATKAAKAVVQLDAETLQVVKVWPSCFAAQKELGIKNVQRAIVRHGISGGFYWCRPGDEEDFKPMDKRASNRVPKKADTDKPKPLTPEQKQLHKKVFDAPTRLVPKTLQEEHDNLQQAINEHVDEVLRGCTQDELIAELRRRQWKGTLHITQTIEL